MEKFETQVLDQNVVEWIKEFCKVKYPDEDGDVWVCTSDHNIYAPGVFGWERED